MKGPILILGVVVLLLTSCGNRMDHSSDSPKPPGKTTTDTTSPEIMPGTPSGDTGTGSAPSPKDTAYLHHPGAKRAMDTATHLPNKD